MKSFLRDMRGFTVIEAIGALSLVSLLGAMAMPNIHEMNRVYTVRGVAMNLYFELENARMEAVTRNEGVARVTQTDATTYELHHDTNGNGAIDADETVKVVDITSQGPGVEISSGSVAFGPNGTTDAAASFTVSDGKSSRTVSVNRTGRIRVL